MKKYTPALHYPSLAQKVPLASAMSLQACSLCLRFATSFLRCAPPAYKFKRLSVFSVIYKIIQIWTPSTSLLKECSAPTDIDNNGPPGKSFAGHFISSPLKHILLPLLAIGVAVLSLSVVTYLYSYRTYILIV